MVRIGSPLRHLASWFSDWESEVSRLLSATIAPEEGQDQQEPEHLVYETLRTLQFGFGTQQLPICALVRAELDTKPVCGALCKGLA